ncbi:MAG: serine/threonine-protein kinase [Eubacteriales bacterium]|nr:serine/threonine-protein kinase [Eubacteriales bacterium]
MDKNLPVSVWPEWEIIEKIGEGSYGKVYKAERIVNGLSFYSAIKVLTIPSGKSELNGVLSDLGDEQSAKKYFEDLLKECAQEITMMEYFRGNSNMVSVEDYKVVEYLDEIGWDIYIRMEFLTSFLEYSAEHAMTKNKILQLGIDLCKSLQCCNRYNIIHRDIKPENIFVSEFGDFKLGDFGIARKWERTMSGFSKKGTYSYMAPEMYRGEAYDYRADIYSLGIVLYKLLNHNRLPFLDLNKQLITYHDKEAALNRRMSGEKMPYPIDAGEELGKIVNRACEFDPEKRYKTPDALRKDLEGILYGTSDKKETAKDEELPFSEFFEDEQIEKDAFENTREVKNIAEDISERKKKEKKANNKKRVSIWVVTAIIISALASAGAVALYMKDVVERTVREQQKEMLELLNKSDYALNPELVDDFSESIQQVKDHATEIVNNLQSYRRVGKEEEQFLYYDENNNLMKALVYPEYSEDGVYEEYYYWNNELFFAYIWSGENEEMYYYNSGKMIRWIAQDGTCHDEEWDDSEYQERGEKYWNRSEALLERSEASRKGR